MGRLDDRLGASFGAGIVGGSARWRLSSTSVRDGCLRMAPARRPSRRGSPFTSEVSPRNGTVACWLHRGATELPSHIGGLIAKSATARASRSGGNRRHRSAVAAPFPAGCRSLFRHYQGSVREGDTAPHSSRADDRCPGYRSRPTRASYRTTPVPCWAPAGRLMTRPSGMRNTEAPEAPLLLRRLRDDSAEMRRIGGLRVRKDGAPCRPDETRPLK